MNGLARPEFRRGGLRLRERRLALAASRLLGKR